MNKETLENNIKKNYKKIQNYLNGDPGTEGFLNSLAELQTDFADYLIEILKTKKYGKVDVKKSNIYQGHIKGGKEKYINNDKLENIVAEKVLGKKVSINSLLDEGIKKLEELFDTQKSFEDALKSGKLQSIQLNDVILPPNDLPTRTIEGVEIKNLSQNKLWIFVSTLRELGIYDDDLIIYSGKVKNNMMRKNSYYAIFIPRINKTVFLNTGYSEATFVCYGEVSIDKMTTLGKEKLQNELGAIRIKFFENNINLRKSELSNVLLGEGGKVGKKVEVKKIRDKINRSAELDKIKNFYIEHKDDTFIDSDGKKSTVKNLFSKLNYYKTNYKRVNEQLSPEINFPGNPSNYYDIRWNEFLTKLGIEVNEYEIMSLNDLKLFYSEHKDDTFIDSNGKKSTVQKLFLNSRYYLNNYKELNKNLNIKLPGNPTNYYNNITRTEIQKELGINKDFREIISLDELKIFYSKHKDDSFIDSEGNKSTIEILFSNLRYYSENYKIINKTAGIKLPAEPKKIYNIHWEKFLQELGIEVDEREIISLDTLKSFYSEHKNDSFIDSEGNKSTVEKLFSSSLDYYLKNYSILNNKFSLNYKLPGKPTNYYDITRNKFLQELGIGVDTRKIMSLDDLKNFYLEHKNESFIDSDGNPSTIEDLFSTLKYYKENCEIINKTFSLNFKLSTDPKQYYKIGWKKIKAFLGT